MIDGKFVGVIKIPTKFNMTQDLVRASKRVIIPDIVDRLDKSVDIKGSAHPRPSDSTLRARRTRRVKPSSSDKPLIDTGEMRKSLKAKSEGRNRASITIKPIRRAIGKILQEKMGYRWFGISRQAEKESIDLLLERIEEIIRRAQRRRIR